MRRKTLFKTTLKQNVLSLLMAIILLQMCALPTYAASYPTMYPDDYDIIKKEITIW